MSSWERPWPRRIFLEELDCSRDILVDTGEESIKRDGALSAAGGVRESMMSIDAAQSDETSWGAP